MRLVIDTESHLSIRSKDRPGPESKGLQIYFKLRLIKDHVGQRKIKHPNIFQRLLEEFGQAIPLSPHDQFRGKKLAIGGMTGAASIHLFGDMSYHHILFGKSRSENRIWGPLLPLAFSSWGLPFALEESDVTKSLVRFRPLLLAWAACFRNAADLKV